MWEKRERESYQEWDLVRGWRRERKVVRGERKRGKTEIGKWNGVNNQNWVYGFISTKLIKQVQLLSQSNYPSKQCEQLS